MTVMVNSFKDLIRTALRIRVKRRLDPAGHKPEPGARIILNGMRLRVDAPMSEDTWQWLVLQGWRECRFRQDRRRYIDLPRRAFERLRLAPPGQRERVHRKILEYAQKKSGETVSN